MKVLVTGANGFLGYYLVRKLLDRLYTVIATGKGPCRLPYTGVNGFIYEEMDFTDPFKVHDVFGKYAPNVVIHAGAISKVDECEQNQWMAFATNTEATISLLMNAAENNSFFVFVSTDFVFDGERGMYREDDLPNPVNYYGRTKAEAEDAVKEYPGEWAIVRTVLVYGKPQLGRGNILSIVKDKLEKGENYNVVNDQVRTPTYVGDLADGIIAVIEKHAKGIFHISGEEVLTPYQMACRAAEFLGKDANLIRRVTQENFTQPARRPLRTGFIIDKAKKELGYQPVSFEEGLRRTFGEEESVNRQ
jgi:dTDP-4-dehydrorhamnose reductase